MAFTESHKRHISLRTLSSFLPSSRFEPWSPIDLSASQPKAFAKNPAIIPTPPSKVHLCTLEAFALGNILRTQPGNPILQDAGPSIHGSMVAS
jgi:hypothetical protein